MPPALALPLGAIMHMYKAGRTYLPLPAAELRGYKANILSIYNRNGKPLPANQMVDLGAAPIPGTTPNEIPGATPVGNDRAATQRPPAARAGAATGTAAAAQRATGAAGQSTMPTSSSTGNLASRASSSSLNTDPSTTAAGFVRPAPYTPTPEPAEAAVTFLGDKTFGSRCAIDH